MKTYNDILKFVFANNDVSKEAKTTLEYSLVVKGENLAMIFVVCPLKLRSGDLNYRVYVSLGFEKYKESSIANPYTLNSHSHNYNAQIHREGFYNVNAELEFLLDEKLNTRFSAFYTHVNKFDQKCDTAQQQKFYFRSKKDKEIDGYILEHFSKLQMFHNLSGNLEIKDEKKKKAKI
ncbi:TPA: hypothetical protein QDB06_000860 [Burkholderia vietnamiensis]|nr:hypothetical protein [Burkholderia vietnamiensis]